MSLLELQKTTAALSDVVTPTEKETKIYFNIFMYLSKNRKLKCDHVNDYMT